MPSIGQSPVFPTSSIDTPGIDVRTLAVLLLCAGSIDGNGLSGNQVQVCINSADTIIRRLDSAEPVLAQVKS
jgi:hypothetical protein